MTNSKKVISFIMSLVALASTPTFAGINASAEKDKYNGKNGSYQRVDFYYNNSADQNKNIECDINNDGNTDYCYRSYYLSSKSERILSRTDTLFCQVESVVKKTDISSGGY